MRNNAGNEPGAWRGPGCQPDLLWQLVRPYGRYVYYALRPGEDRTTFARRGDSGQVS